MIERLTKSNISILENSFIDKKIILENLKNNPFANYLIYIENNQVIAYLYYSDIYDRTEINSFEVRMDKRNNKVGTKLLTYYLTITNKPSTLEVRKSNIPAISLYKKCGYKKVAIRKNYYQTEDGILMERSEWYEWRKRYIHIGNRK